MLLISLISIPTANTQTMETRKITINGETLSYFDNEKGETTLLFIHGAFINKEYWENQLTHFAPSFRVIAIDLAGHGDSSHNRTEWTAQSFGKDINEFIRKLSLKKIILIGHSAGSDIMLEAVTDDSSEIKGLIEVDHFKNVGVALPQEMVHQLVAGLKTDFIQTCRQFAKQALLTEKTDAKLVDQLLADYGKMNPEVGISMLQSGFNYSKRETELLEGLEMKLYLVHVDYIPTNEESLKMYLGDSYELHIMEGTCHYPMLENPDEFNNILEKILSEINGK